MFMSIASWVDYVCVSSIVLPRTRFGGAINIMTDFTFGCHWLVVKDA